MKIERPLALKVYSVLCSKFIVSHFLRFVNILGENLLNYLPGDRKEPPLCKCEKICKQIGTACRDGGIVNVRFEKKTIPQPPLASAPFAQGSLFNVHLYHVNFPDKHCICVHKCKNTVYLL